MTMFDAMADPDFRRPFVRTATWLLEEWPERFLAHAQAAHTRPSDFVPRCVRVPKWFLDLLQANLTGHGSALTTNSTSKSLLFETPLEPMVKKT